MRDKGDIASGLNPFPGLRAFKNTEYDLFFGREEHIAEVKEKLENHHFVAVVGTSGTGKSSLIRAGVLPSIQKEKKNDGSSKWDIVSLMPGDSPIKNLAEAVSGAIEEPDFQERSFELMQRSSLGLVQAVRGKIQDGSRLLILVDQFEEVFRFAGKVDEDRAKFDRFVRILVDTMRQRDVPVYIILTLRSDFLGDCVRFEGLPEAINDGHYLVPRMRNEQIKRVITGPIAHVNGKISPRLVGDIYSSLTDDQDQLPILQHALMRTYETWEAEGVKENPIDIQHLQAVGGLQNALSIHADEAYNELNGASKELAAKIFKCLTVKTGDNRGVRRPMSLAQLMEVVRAAEAEVLTCLAPFRQLGRNFVLPGEEIEVKPDTIFDISHESLMRGWDRLRSWTDQEMESAELYLRISEAATLHQKGEAALWRDPELQLALDWKEKQNPGKAWADLYDGNFDLSITFLEESKRRDKEERNRKKRRALIIRSAAAIFISVITVLSVWALYQTDVANEKSQEAFSKSQEAIQERDRAEQERERALQASTEAQEARSEAEEQADIAETEKERADQERLRAESAAYQALVEQQKAVEQKELADQLSEEALLEKQKADSARDEAFRLRMVALSQNLAYESGQVQQNPELAALLSIQAYKLATSFGGNPDNESLYSASSRALAGIDPKNSAVVHSHSGEILSMVVDAKNAAIVDESGAFKRYDLKTFQLKDKTETGLPGDQINTAYISSGADRFVLALSDNNFSEFKAGTKTPLNNYQGHQGLIRAIDFTSKASLGSGARDGRVIIWQDGTEKQNIDLGSRVRCLTSDGTDHYAGCENGAVYKIQGNTKSILTQRSGKRVEAIDLSGSLIAIGYSDGTCRLVNKQGKVIKDLSGIGSLNYVALVSRTGDLVTLTSSKVLRIYDVANLTSLPIEIKLNRSATSMCYDDTGSQIYVACADNKVYKFPSRTKSIVDQLSSKVNRELSREEWSTFMGDDLPYNSIEFVKN